MKKLTKMALAISMAMAGSAALAQVTLVDELGNDLVTYNYGKMEVENGAVTITGAAYVSGDLPGFEPGDRTCGAGTTDTGGTCVVNLSQVCGANTTEENGQCVGETPDLTPPTLNITSSTNSMGDGVSTATITFQFSRAVQGFSSGDVSVSQGSISNFNQVNSSRWQATYNRSGNNSGSVTISVNSNSYQGTNGVNGGGDSHSITLSGAPVNIGNCTIPNNVNLSTSPAVTTFGQAGSAITFKVPRSPTILSHPFTTTASSTVSGSVDLAGMSYTSDHIKRMWISDCAGGPAISSRCDQSGITSTLKWAQRNVRATCELDTSTTYFFNVSYPENSGSCSSSAGCDALIHHKGGW